MGLFRTLMCPRRPAGWHRRLVSPAYRGTSQPNGECLMSRKSLMTAAAIVVGLGGLAVGCTKLEEQKTAQHVSPRDESQAVRSQVTTRPTGQPTERRREIGRADQTTAAAAAEAEALVSAGAQDVYAPQWQPPSTTDER